MSFRLRTELWIKIKRCFETTELPGSLNTALRSLNLRLDGPTGEFLFSLPVKTKDYDIRNAAENIVGIVRPDDFFSGIAIRREKHSENLLFFLNRERCIKDIIESEPRSVGITDKDYSSHKKIVVEYSSPNIAKPFHVGHLRSTILGNYIANINDYLCNDVKRINYLGDWGTQFGFIQLGIDSLNISDEEMRQDPIRILYKAYVHANKLGETDPLISEKARKIFNELESGVGGELEKWETFRRYTVDELAQTYKRLGINFHEYDWESNYKAKDMSGIISRMESQEILNTDREGRRVIALSEERSVPIMKSDGSTLYITRDIAAAVDRFDKYKFDNMYYVVDNAQTDHFVTLSKILDKMGFPWSNKIKHIKFGRIRDMSTRKGTAIFLKDIMDETQMVMKEKQIKSPNTKVELDYGSETTDILGISAIIINDLKQRRLRDYVFDWDKALDIKGDTGVKLQYVHCRLTSLEENSGAKLPEKCDPSVLNEPIIGQLVLEIGKFDEAILRSHQEFEPCILVNYLFSLSNTVNKGLKILRVKGEPTDIGSQRLLVFHAAKNILAQGMKLLGLQPLNKM